MVWSLCMFMFMFMFVASMAISANQIRSEAELELLKEKILTLKAQMQGNRQKQDTLVSDLEEMERQLAEQAMAQRSHQNQLESLYTTKAGLKNKLNNLDIASVEARKNINQLVRMSYLMSQQDSLKMVLNQNVPSDISRTLSTYRYIVDSRRQQIEQMRTTRADLIATKTEIEIQQNEIDGVIADLNKNRLALEQAEKARQQQLALVQQKLSADESKVSLYQEREAELKLLLANLQRNKQQSQASESQDEYQSSSTIVQLVAGAFRNNQGRLPMPTAAKIKNRYGQIKADSGLVWEGLMFNVREGQPVSAIYDGQVIYSDWFRGYGQLLVLDHGDGYMSLYGHNQQLHVELGSTVGTNQVIALAGSTGGLVSPGLYFEIRHNGTPDDPLKWCHL